MSAITGSTVRHGRNAQRDEALNESELSTAVNVSSQGSLLSLDEPDEIATFRTRLSEGLDRWAHFAFPGGDDAAEFDYSRQNSTDYVEGEHIYIGDRGYVCTTAGTTAASLPTFDNTTIRPKGANSGGSTTTDGTVVWELVLDTSTDFGGSSWEGGSRQARTAFTNHQSLWYYEPGFVVWQYIDYLDGRGELTEARRKKLEVYASYHLSNYLQRNPFSSAPQGYLFFTDCTAQDYIRDNESRYKYAATVSLSDLETQVTTRSLYSPEGQPAWYTGSFPIENEDVSREIAYIALGALNYAKASGVHLDDVTFGGVTENRFRWFIPVMLNHMHQWMNGVDHTNGSVGFAPFMFALTAHTLIEWYEYELSQGRDPDRYVIDGAIGTVDYGFTWSDSEWPTIPAALEDFTYWLRFTAEDTNGDPMWVDASKTYRYRVVENDLAVDLGNLICPVHAWLAKHTLENGNTTSWTPETLMAHADEQFNATTSQFFYSTTNSSPSYFYGKQYAEGMKLAFKYLSYRNAASGRGD